MWGMGISQFSRIGAVNMGALALTNCAQFSDGFRFGIVEHVVPPSGEEKVCASVNQKSNILQTARLTAWKIYSLTSLSFAAVF
jgi:hypothetical protein